MPGKPHTSERNSDITGDIIVLNLYNLDQVTVEQRRYLQQLYAMHGDASQIGLNSGIFYLTSGMNSRHAASHGLIMMGSMVSHIESKSAHLSWSARRLHVYLSILFLGFNDKTF